MNIFNRIKKYIAALIPSGGVFQAVVELPEFRPLTGGLSDGPPALVRAMQAADVGDFLTTLFNMAISVGAILAVLRLGYAGFVYMTTDAISDKSRAKEIIQNAVIGLLLLLAVVLILERINPDILEIDFALDGSSATQTPAGNSPFPTP